MINHFNKKIIFCFSDPAGAKSILSFIERFEIYFLDFIVITDRKYQFFSDFKININVIEKNEVFKIISIFKPDLIITGTSVPNKFEINILKYAIKLSIFTISFIDHFTNLYERFEIDNEVILPDLIYVIDLSVKKEILKLLKLNDKRVKVIKNPTFRHLKLKKITTNQIEIKNKYQLPNHTDIISFFPEPLFQYEQSKKYGFSEFDIIDDLLKIFIDKNNAILIIKIHPNHNIALFSKYKNYQNVIVTDKIQIEELSICSKLILGIFSNALLESYIFNKNTYQLLHRLSNLSINPLKNVSQIKKLYNFMELNKILN